MNLSSRLFTSFLFSGSIELKSKGAYMYITSSQAFDISNSNMAPRLSGQTSIFGVVFFERPKKLKIYNFDPKASGSC